MATELIPFTNNSLSPVCASYESQAPHTSLFSRSCRKCVCMCVRAAMAEGWRLLFASFSAREKTGFSKPPAKLSTLKQAPGCFGDDTKTLLAQSTELLIQLDLYIPFGMLLLKRQKLNPRKHTTGGSSPAAILTQILIKFQCSYAQCDLARTAAVRRPASKCRRLLLESFRPGFGRLCFKVQVKAMAEGISAACWSWRCRRTPQPLTAAPFLRLPRSTAETILFYQNSIRHNLSLHSKFIRVQNEGTGKSSWWMLNPEGGKSGKSPRRRAASMDNNSKFAKSRGRAAKKKASLQSGQEGNGDSPGSQFSKWPPSPSSHSNDDFDNWSTFRPRTSSNASTISGRLSPILPEQDDLGDGDVHSMVYPSSTTKMTSTLPSLSEMSNSENMENLLDNLNLLSPNTSMTVSTQSSSATLMQQTPGYSFASSTTSIGSPNPDYRKFTYAQASMNSLSQIPMQTLQDSKSSYGSMNQYSCPAGLLKELLTSDSPPHSDILASVDTGVSQAGGRALGQNVLMVANSVVPNYGGQPPHGKMMNPNARPHQGHNQPAPAVNGRALSHSVSTMSHTSGLNRLSTVKTSLQVPMSHPMQMNAMNPYAPVNSCNGYGRVGIVSLHQEKLPSDLDDMLIERLDCDMESIIRNDLMDGETLDFNFDSVLPNQSFQHSAMIVFQNRTGRKDEWLPKQTANNTHATVVLFPEQLTVSISMILVWKVWKDKSLLVTEKTARQMMLVKYIVLPNVGRTFITSSVIITSDKSSLNENKWKKATLQSMPVGLGERRDQAEEAKSEEQLRYQSRKPQSRVTRKLTSGSACEVRGDCCGIKAGDDRTAMHERSTHSRMFHIFNVAACSDICFGERGRAILLSEYLEDPDILGPRNIREGHYELNMENGAAMQQYPPFVLRELKGCLSNSVSVEYTCRMKDLEMHEESLAAMERGEPELPISVLLVVMATQAGTSRRWSDSGPEFGFDLTRVHQFFIFLLWKMLTDFRHFALSLVTSDLAFTLKSSFTSRHLIQRLMFPEPAVPKVRHSSHICLGTDSNSIQTELSKKPEHATLDFQGDTSIPVWVLRECPGYVRKLKGALTPDVCERQCSYEGYFSPMHGCQSLWSIWILHETNLLAIRPDPLGLRGFCSMHTFPPAPQQLERKRRRNLCDVLAGTQQQCDSSIDQALGAGACYSMKPACFFTELQKAAGYVKRAENKECSDTLFFSICLSLELEKIYIDKICNIPLVLACFWSSKKPVAHKPIVSDVSRGSITISLRRITSNLRRSWKFRNIREYISACQEPSERVLNVMIRETFTKRGVGKQELAAPMIHCLLTHLRSRFLHPPMAVGNRRHSGTSAPLEVFPQSTRGCRQHFVQQQRSGGKHTV
ncbi:hypothetical protein IHE44_0005408 [Lamprotornis superbus]|uniref:Fork-head domain-containing protein n=1 Tax=Lamprotornis superbus TaxID=245042 RepID=A0A835NM67_9PASS|nr:hypothetical protein IHE44_0005408 [Lamprotornis superbus]